jgi:uncharacterized protein YdeI (YjbR/CyaY-like superfamily)
MNPQIEHFFEKSSKWKDEYTLLREIILQENVLVEDYKWMHPCYTLNGKNVLLIHGFKEYCAVLFHKGALLTDPKGMLIQQTENVQSARQIRFTDSNQIMHLKEELSWFIQQAIEIEKSGKKVELKKAADYPIPEEFQQALNEDSALNTAFYGLTPGRQKGYLFHFNQAKQAQTRLSRIEKYYQHILNGKGIDD